MGPLSATSVGMREPSFWFSAISIAISVAIVTIAIARISVPIGNLIIANWVAFGVATLVLVSRAIGLEKRDRMRKRAMGVWVLVFASFTFAGLVARSMGAAVS